MPGRPKKPARLYLRTRAGREPQWVIRDGEREHATGCGRAEHSGAQSALAQYIASVYQPPAGPARLDALTVDDILLAYLRERAPRVASRHFIGPAARALIGWWTGRTLDQIRGATCRAYVEWRTAQTVARTGRPVSCATARHDLSVLRAALGYWHREHGPLPALPAVELPEAPQPRDRWLTRPEAARLLRAARRDEMTGHLARFVLIGLATGTRSGAILRLSWLPSTSGGWIDLDRGVMHRRGRAERVTAKRQPPVRLPDRLAGHLARWRARDLALGIPHVIHWQGRPVTKLRRSWDGARRRAGLGADVVPHTLRHTCATWLMQAGVDRYEAAGFLGMSMATLEAVYGHHSPDFQARAASARPRNAPEMDRTRREKQGRSP